MNDSHYIKRQTTAYEVQDPRQTEAYALVEIARRMDTVRQNTASTREEMVEVFQLNWRLWTIFQSEISNPDSQLPDAIKVNMLQLANFIDKHTIEQIREPKREGMDVLININRQVGAGLLGDQGGELAEEQTAPAATDKSAAKVEEARADKPKFRSKKVAK